MKRRALVTGLGMITPLGIGVQNNWEAVCSGESGIRPIIKFDPSPFPSQIGGEVVDFRPEDFMDRQKVRRFDSFIHFAVASARMAIEESGLKIDANNCHRVGCLTGSGLGGLTMLEHYHKILLEKGPRKIRGFGPPGYENRLALGRYHDARKVEKRPEPGEEARCGRFAFARVSDKNIDILGFHLRLEAFDSVRIC